MTGRERIEAALSPDGARDLGAVICYEGIYIRDRWDDLTGLPWWYRHAPDAARQLEWRLRVVSRLRQDWVALPSFSPRADVVLEERPGGVFLVNEVSGEERKLEREIVGGWHEPYARSVGINIGFPESREQVDERIPLTSDFDPVAFSASGRGQFADAFMQALDGGLFPMGYAATPYSELYMQWGFEEVMVSIAERPAIVDYACERLMGVCLHRVREAAALGAAGVWLEDCMSDMIGRRAFERLNLPYLRRLVDEIRALGMKSVHYFCGNPAGKWDLLLSTGADALSLEESKKGFEIDIEEIVDRVQGRCAVLGNLDAVGVLERGTDEALRAEIARQIRAGRRNGSRFIMSIGSPVTPGTPPERVRLYTDLAHDLGAPG